MKPILAALLVSSILTASSSALAAPDAAAAESLFQRGVERLKANDWVEACKAFEASMKLDPSVGTQINVARCSEHDGHLAQAWADYKKAKTLNSETPLEKRKANVDSFVDAAIKKLEPRLPFVTVKVTIHGPPGQPTPKASDIAGLKVARDDTPIPVEGLGVAVPVDPGRHIFEASAPSYRSAKVEMDFTEAAKRDIALEIFYEPPPKAPPFAPVVPPRVVPDGGGQASNRSVLITGITLAAVGGATLIVSAVTGGIALSDRKTIDKLVQNKSCTEAGGTLQCSAQSKTEAHDALTRGKMLSLVSTVTVFEGAALASAGLVMTIVGATSSNKAPPSRIGFVPLIGPGVAGGFFSGTFE